MFFSKKNRTPVTKWYARINDCAVLVVTCTIAIDTWSNKQRKAISPLQYFNVTCFLSHLLYTTVKMLQSYYLWENVRCGLVAKFGFVSTIGEYTM